MPELKTRTERLHPFDSAREVEAALHDMSARDPALVARVDQAPGQREADGFNCSKSAPTGGRR